ncbi:MAG TPA: acetyl-CoA carboxylase, carboxyltransferase subunit beta [Terriglobia bacterium]|nr:acetyl-CoA carboxylase, carboxyltransferase subunit beta [Terriglobia bacterium]HVQ63104.1 acetyl-CoA carboxylase, carboxyltransferase subunit beta [Terriglobia bacterium]
MSWFKRDRKSIDSSAEDRRVLTEGLWIKCDGCREPVWKKDLEANGNLCPKCGFHYRITAYERLDLLLDEGWTEFDSTLYSTDPLKFKAAKAYKDSIEALPKRVGVRDAVVNAEGSLSGIRVIVSAMEYNFIGGSMGSVVGEKITRAVERSSKENRPLVVVSCSGGARMQEGALSLMQMAKISAALAVLDKKAIPYISILTNPTTGGVTASFAMLGDLNIAEPGALIGFAGPRVIEQTIRQKLPEGFQRAEFLVEHGMVDAIVSRKDLKAYIATSLRLFNR